jgi:diguanylate cyclase (GGDEF)-like protein
LLNTERDAAVALVEALREQIASAPLVYGEQQIYLTVTMGLAQWPTDGMTVEQLYRCADQRLYRGKAQGRNRLVSDNT